MVYGVQNNFDDQLKKYLLDPIFPREKKKLEKDKHYDTKFNDFKGLRGRLLRNIALMQLYACGAPRKVNGKLESWDSVLDCSEFFQHPERVKDDFKEIWEHGGKRSQVDRLGKELTIDVERI